MRQAGLFGLSDHLKRLSAVGDPLETMDRAVDFEAFRPVLDAALAYSEGSKGGRPPYDPVAMLKVLILAAQNNVGDAKMEFLIRDRLSWLRFLGFDLGALTPDENTIRLFRERLTAAGALDTLFADFDRQLRERATCRWEDKSWTRRWWQRPSSATPQPRRQRSRRVSRPVRYGRTSRPVRRRRTPMRAGR